MTDKNSYGVGDASYLAAGSLDGITKLVDDFYDAMSVLHEAKKIRGMHPSDLTLSRQKLVYFLSGWLGGPKLYQEHYGAINIPKAHSFLAASKEDGEAWLLCMQKSVDQQTYTAEFSTYLMAQLRIPAERIVEVGGG